VPSDGELPIAIEESDQLRDGEAWRVAREHLAGVKEAYLVHVRQIESVDHIDDAWTAPIWIEEAAGPEAEPQSDEPSVEGFVRSKNSQIYHLRSCSIAKQIELKGTLVPHIPKPGDGTRLHKNCPSS